MAQYDQNKDLGFSGSIAQKFLTTEITFLLALLGLLLGVFAVMVTPREEEPQINVTFANVFIAFPGASAKEVESLVSVPAEQSMSEIEGIKHVYSVSRPGLSILTVEYEVGQDRTQAIVRLYNKIFSRSDWYPAGLGVAQPIIKPKGIDDVPIVSITLWTKDENRSGYDLLQVAHGLEAELKRVPGTRDIFTIGGSPQVVKVLLDAQKLSAYGLSLNALQQALSLGNVSMEAGMLVNDQLEIPVTAGSFFASPQEIADLVVSVNQGKPVYLHDIADIQFGAADPASYVFHGKGLAQGNATQPVTWPAVTIAIAKKPGTNAVDIANAVVERMQHLQGIFLPEGVEATITRNYGKTADDKAQTLIKKLMFATAIVVLLVLVTLGRKEALIVGAAVIITLAITLFASWAWGFTLNRVSLFALIFSIGILVDDAIVVVENIHRHLSKGDTDLLKVIPRAVDEVGGPTILATFTVIAALLPMAFVTGLMGPYMSPIPINASMGMLISLAVAFVITPWMVYRVFHKQEIHVHAETTSASVLDFFQRAIGPFLDDDNGKPRRRKLALGVLGMILISLVLVYSQHVVLKMLPFDNKSEFQIVVDMPEGTPLEQTSRVMDALAAHVASVPEVTDYQVYAGTASPINFNGLVRQYYLREG
ncbi:MAG TPA: efflux RND transporter permease subunit, partial [Gammaproteobacteria bacterium]